MFAGGGLVSPLEGVYYVLEIEKKTMLARSLNWRNPKKGNSPPSFLTPYPCSPQPNHKLLLPSPVDTGLKLNVHKTFSRCPGRLLNVLCTFNLRPVSTGSAKTSKQTPKLKRTYRFITLLKNIKTNYNKLLNNLFK